MKKKSIKNRSGVEYRGSAMGGDRVCAERRKTKGGRPAELRLSKNQCASKDFFDSGKRTRGGDELK